MCQMKETYDQKTIGNRSFPLYDEVREKYHQSVTLFQVQVLWVRPMPDCLRTHTTGFVKNVLIN